MPLRIQIVSQCIETLATQQGYFATCKDIPRIEKQEPHSRKLAIVGGGQSTKQKLGMLRSWDGDIWGINSIASWLALQGVKSTYVTIDPGTPTPDECEGFVEDALIASSCHPDNRKRFKNVRLFDIVELNPAGIVGGTTTATRLPFLAAFLGYRDITFFGCEGSFPQGESHVNRNEIVGSELYVRAGDNLYLTTLQFLQQCETLAKILSNAPETLKSESGGLLDAMIQNMDTWQIEAVSGQLRESMLKIEGNSDIFTIPYQEA